LRFIRPRSVGALLQLASFIILASAVRGNCSTVSANGTVAQS
jgi:hypothetical protein